MALDFKKAFSRASAKTRVLVAAVTVIAVAGVIFLGVRWLSGGSNTSGRASVATAPGGLQSIPGGKLTPEYSQALVQANAQAAKQAQQSGSSAVPTLVNVAGQQAGFPQATENCTVLCNETADVADDINNLIRGGTLSQEDGNALLDLAKNNVSVNESGEALSHLVRRGKLAPEQARRLLEEYQKQHDTAAISGSAKLMDSLIKSGKLPLDVATHLLDLQKKNVSPEEYTAEVNRLVKEGKITPEVAAQLLAQYTQQKAQEAAQEGASQLRAMAKSGEITADAAEDLIALQKRNVTPAEYAAALDKLVQAGKMTPATAAKLLQQYQASHPGAAGTAGALNGLVAAAEATAANDINDMVKSGKLSPDAANDLLQLQKNGASAADYQNALNKLVQAGKLSPADAQRLMASYQKLQGVRQEAQNLMNQNAQQQAQDAAKEGIKQLQLLAKSGQISPEVADDLINLQKKNVPVSEYSAELARLVNAGKLTPAMADRLLQQYQAQRASGGPADALNAMVTNAEAQAAGDVTDLLHQGRISPDAAKTLIDLQKKGVTPQEYQAALNQLVRAGKLSADDAKQLMANYQKAQDVKTNGSLKDDIDSLVGQGKLSADAANKLADLQNRNVSPQEYQAALDQLVRSGQLTPDDAKRLMQKYQKAQAAGADLKNDVNALVSQGKLSQEAANKLLELQNRGASPKEYQDALNQLVQSGKLSPEDAKRLMDKYEKAQGGVTAQNTTGAQDLQDLVSHGKLSQEGADKLLSLQKRKVSPQEYQDALNQLVQAGKLSPEDAQRLLDKYTQSLGAAGDVNDLVKQGKLSQAAADQLLDLQRKNVSPQAYQDALNQLVKTGQLSADDAARLMAGYQKLQGVRDEAQKLLGLQANNASVGAYSDELKRAVQNGIMSPEMAAKLLQDYENFKQGPAVPPPTGVAPGAEVNVPENQAFAALTQRLREKQTGGAAPTAGTAQQFANAAAQAEAQAEQQRQQHIKELMGAMAGQAQSLIATWQPPSMQHVGGSVDVSRGKEKGAVVEETISESNKGGQRGQYGATSGGIAPALIKTGTILFAVLDTAVDSDYPDTPVLATIVQGKLKGAKLLGKLTLVSGKDRVSLAFNLLDKDEWPATKSISAFAIDPETARTILATDVDHHYLMRYGSMMATSFMSGYSSAITQAGTSTTGIFGTSSVHPALSPGNKFAVGLGQIGTTMGTAIQSYINTPATVKVRAGVGLGILFMADVPSEDVVVTTKRSK